MKSRRLNIVLSCICIILAIMCCVLATSERNEDPYFRAEDGTFVYTEGMSEQELLEGISAYDREDGEISDRITIRSQMKSVDGFTVIYVVKDNNGSQATYTRTYQINSEEETTLSTENDTSQAENEETEPVAEESSQQLESEISQENQESVDVNPEVPVLILNADSAVITAGSSFNYWDYIASIEDNKDSKEYLAGQIVVSGDYNFNVPGTYELEFWVLDSDGNRCVPQKFQLTVQ